MNYFLLALALGVGFVALLYIVNIFRVAIGQIRWASTGAFIFHIVLAPTLTVLAIWLFRTAVAA